MANLQQTITTGRYTLPVTIFVTLCGWVAVYMLAPELSAKAGTPLWEYVGKYLPDWSQRGLSLVFTLFAGHFLVQLNNSFALIRRRASMQTSIYFLFVAVCPLVEAVYPSAIIVIPVMFAVHNLFRCYQCQNPSQYVLNSFVFLGLGTLLFPHLFLFVPVFLFGVSYVSNLNFRNLIISIIGLSIPYWFLWAYAYYTNNMAVFYEPFTTLTTFQPVSLETLHHEGLPTYLFFFLLFAISSGNYMANAHKDKIRTRIFLRFLITLVFCLFLYIFLQPVYSIYLLSLALAGLSVLVAHFFVLTNSKASNLFFVCTILGLILLFVHNIWILL